MTAVDDRPQAQDHAQMGPEEFEALAAYAARTVEGLRLEFLGGKLGVKAVPDGLHGEIIMWLQRVCMQHNPDWGLYAGLGLKVETYRKGHAIPDGTLAPEGYFVPAGEWADTGGVLMTVEVTSYDRDTTQRDTTQRDRIDKPRVYAESGIPVFLLVDRDTREVNVYSEPVDGAYTNQHIVPFGKSVTLPEPVGFELDTERLLELVNRAAG